MTSERRAYIIVIALTIGAAATAASMVTTWTIGTACGVIAAAAAAFVAGMSKSPRDGKLSDDADPSPTEVTATLDTTKTVHAESDQEEHV